MYQLRSEDLKNAMDLSPTFEGVCSACASGLAGISRGFFKLKQQGKNLKKERQECQLLSIRIASITAT